MQRAAAEAIGTFALVGAAMIHAIGDVSGAHLDPVAAQLVGAGSASLLVRAIFGAHTNLGATLPATGV